MGGPRKPKKQYITPGHPWQKDRLVEELRLMGQYGLRSKRELWRIRTQLAKYRAQARRFLALPEEEMQQRLGRLVHRLGGLGVMRTDGTIDDILQLRTEDFLRRRLQSVVYTKGLATTPYHARQLITHGHIALQGRKMTIPGYLVPQEEEEFLTYAPSSPLTNELHPSRPGREGPGTDGGEEQNSSQSDRSRRPRRG
jgi:small subunit ribosomal protein S4